MKYKLALLALGSALLCRAALAQDQKQPAKPEAAKAPDAAKAATLEIYVAVMPFIENVRAEGPTREGFAEGPGHIGIAVATYNGVKPAPRFRMTSGTSYFGVRGSLALAQQLRVVGQVETAMPVDGDPNPWESDIPNRNSYLGLTGDWGTLALGRLDTPYKWMTLTTVNPIKMGYVADYTPIIGTPGFLATALNSVPRWVAGNGVSNAAFYRRESNSIQYWSRPAPDFQAACCQKLIDCIARKHHHVEVLAVEHALLCMNATDRLDRDPDRGAVLVHACQFG